MTVRMLLSADDFPRQPALREVARALCYMATPPQTGVVEIRLSSGKITQVLAPECILTETMPLGPTLVPLTAEQWAVVRLIERRLAQARQGHHSGTLRVVVAAGVPQRSLGWRPSFVVRSDE